MGCGGSKLENTQVEGVPPKLRPLLWRRLEDIKRRRLNAGRETETLSKKELLRGVSDDDISSQPISHDDKISVSSQEDNLKVVPVMSDDHAKVEEALSVGSSEDIGEKSNKLDGNDRDKEEEKEVEVMAMAEAAVDLLDKTDGDEEEKSDDAEDDEDDERMVGRGLCICPGSPSFRVFFTDSLADNAKDDDDKEEETEEILQNDDKVQETVTMNPNEETEPATMEIKKKGKKAGNRLRKVMPRSKYLLNVKSCYNPACSSGMNKTVLLSPKA